MANLLINYIIISCIFNLVYYWFNLEDQVIKHVREFQDDLIRELERRDPFHPFLKKLRDRSLQDMRSDIDNQPLFRLMRDILLFPLNLLLILLIMFDKDKKK